MRRRTASTGSIRSPRTPPVTCADAKEYWLKFCYVTPIHGVRYIVDSERPLYERVFWAVVLAVCLYFASAYSKELWLRLTVRSTDFSTQTITKYDDAANIPAPAITFCNHLISTESSNFMDYVCGQKGLEYVSENVTIDINHFIETSALFNVTCLMNHYYYREMDEIYSTNCEKMFTRVITQYGVCYTMNMLDKSQIYKEGVESFQSPHGRKSDWDPDKGYIEGALIADPNGTSDPYNEGPYPKRATSYETKFQIWPGEVGSFCDDDYGVVGVRVALHSPIETPRIGHRNNVWFYRKDDELKPTDYIYLAAGMEYQLVVYPEVISTDIGLKLFPPDQRRCYYPGEKTLAYFEYYSETNCESECLINETMLDCFCYDFYMPHWGNTDACSPQALDCVIDKIEWWKKTSKRECACYPSCNDLKYNTEILYRNIASPKKYQNDSIKLTVLISSDTYVLKEIRRVQSPYFLVDFVANCGGVFGLFCGLSIVSIVELAYYGTIRLATNFFRRKRKKGADQQRRLMMDFFVAREAQIKVH